ncbi:MAG: DegT/DnrJ/EryC1/StrS family aminotransferase [Bryobacteraceae bacterium]
MSTAIQSKTIPIARPSFGPEEEQAVLEVLRSGWVSQGPRVAEFERQFAEYVGAPYAVAVSSCTTALHLALLAAGVKPGDEVLCPSLSFIATANAIVYAGARPVFVDIDKSHYNIDPNGIERAITLRTKAILAVHQIGLPAPLAEIGEIASRHGLVVIEDAACAIGATYKGSRVGRPHTSMACFSFHPRKVLTTGEGGMITTAEEELAGRMRKLRQHAMTVSDVARHSSTRVVIESYAEVGYNYRMTDLQAAIGVAQLQRLDDMIARRRALAMRYSSRLSSIPWLALPTESSECRHNFQSYMVRLRSEAPIGRDELMQKLLDRGVSTRRGIMAIHREPPYCGEEWDEALPVTNLVTDTTMILPLFHEMAEDEQDFVIECIEHIACLDVR